MGADAGPVVAAEGVAKRYGRHAALAGVDVAVARGEAVALLGANGAGKTTLLSLLAGVSRPSEGRIVLAEGARTGWVPQRAALYSRLTARENLRLFARLERLSDPDADAERLLAAVDLARVADRPAVELSVGNAQRLNVALGLLGDPDVVFLDEPSASLDPKQRLVLWQLLSVVTGRGGTVIFATQNVEEANLHAHRLIVLLDGRVAFDGSQRELFARSGVPPTAGFEAAFVAFLDRAAPAAA